MAHYHKENHMQQVKSEKDEHLRLRKIASSIAKEVKYFWDSIRKVCVHVAIIYQSDYLSE